MNFELLSSVVEELSFLITGARVERVYQGIGGGMYIVLNRDRKKFILLLSPDRTLPRLHLVSEKTAASSSPHTFVLYLRSHLAGTRVSKIALMNQDRLVEIRFNAPDAEYRLVFELFGASANIILTDSSLKILAVFYQSMVAEHAVRLLIPGLVYTLPEKKAIRKSGKSLRVDEALPKSLANSSLNRNAETFYQRLKEQKELVSHRMELSSCIRKGLSKTERRISALSKDLDSTDRAEEYKQAGNLVLANLNRLKTGMEQVDLIGYDGHTVAVSLDPKLSPSRNADRFFRKYKKAKTGHDIIPQRLQQAEDEESYLKSLQSQLEQAEEDDFINIRSSLVAKGYLKRRGKEKGKARAEPGSPGYRTIIFRAWEILVGKGAKGNDYITTRIARPDDLWLHAEGMPGSHVLVKNPKRIEVPADVLVKAAALAAFYSKGKTAGKVAVTYTRAGLVKKPRGAKPGLVTLKERKSIMVRPEE